jgi:hypothetical protein
MSARAAQAEANGQADAAADEAIAPAETSA